MQSFVCRMETIKKGGDGYQKKMWGEEARGEDSVGELGSEVKLKRKWGFRGAVWEKDDFAFGVGKNKKLGESTGFRRNRKKMGIRRTEFGETFFLPASFPRLSWLHFAPPLLPASSAHPPPRAVMGGS